MCTNYLEASPRHTDRGSPQLIIPVLLAFKEEGGLDVLDSMLQVFASCIRQGSETDSEESSKPKIASFGLKKVLDIYFILSNGKTVTEASTGVNLQRQTDRGQTVPNIFQQFVVELRASILPSIMELWDSSIVENLAEPTVKRLIDILKLISAAEYEPTSTPSDKVNSPRLPSSGKQTRTNYFVIFRFRSFFSNIQILDSTGALSVEQSTNYSARISTRI